MENPDMRKAITKISEGLEKSLAIKNFSQER